MGELLKEPYEISVWEDELVTQNGDSYYKENRIAVIGSDTMTGMAKVFEPVFTKKANGEKTLSFSLHYKYYDPYSDSEIYNPFATLLVNERKVKLHYENEWYDFIIRTHTETSDQLVWTYECTDAFVLELSKTGYNLEFDAELNNNQGAARELAEKVVENTDWNIGNVDIDKQFVSEPIFDATINGYITVLNVDTNELHTLTGSIFIFYSYVFNRDGKFVQFIKQELPYKVDEKNVITATNYRILTEVTYNGTEITGDGISITLGEVNQEYQANRVAYNQLTTYDPVMKRTVSRYKVGDYQEAYSYVDYTYTVSNVVLNYVTNGENFNLYDNSKELQGWESNVETTEGETKIELVNNPPISKDASLVSLDKLTSIEGFLKAEFADEFSDYKNAIFNSGFEYNTSSIKSIAQDDGFVFRWRAGVGTDQTDLSDDPNLRLVVAKYTRTLIPGGYKYITKVDPDTIILDFTGTPKIKNSYIDTGVLVSDEPDEEPTEFDRYVIDNVVQTPSTKYIYKYLGKDYIWDPTIGDKGKYVLKTNDNFLNYYYLTAKAKRAVTSEELSMPTEKFGIFIYSTSDTKVHYLQDIQLTRLIEDGDGEPVLIGNVPKATSAETTYYYMKPEANETAETIPLYVSIDALAEAGGVSSSKIKPIYNEDSSKILSISASRSNCFNILQTIAETFECWINLRVERDSRGGILLDASHKPKKYVDLNRYAGTDNWAGFKYGINLNSIERVIESDEIVSKLIVEQVQSEYVDSGIMSIRNASSNPSGESFIYNFTYFINQGLIPDREQCIRDLNEFNIILKGLNKQITGKEFEKADLENAVVTLSSSRNVFTTLLNTAQRNINRALNEFESITGETYEKYQAKHTSLDDLDKLTEEDNVLRIIGELYANSSMVNNYSGILTNVDCQYNEVRRKLKGLETYYITVSVAIDDNQERHVRINVSDYTAPFQFILDGQTYSVDINNKYFDIISDSHTVTFINTDTENYRLDVSGEVTIVDAVVAKYSLAPIDSSNKGVQGELDELLEEKQGYINSFNSKYSRFIQEGTWTSNDYINAELYYLDALQVSHVSSQPQISYTINVFELSQIEGFEWYKFDAGQKTYVEDTEFFGWTERNGVLTPAREEVFISEIEWHLDEPDTNVITVQNYKTHFEDLFQRISAAVQTVQYNEAAYAKISTILDGNGTISADVLLNSLNKISGRNYQLTSDGSVFIDGDMILIRNLTNTANLVKIESEGIKISSNGGLTWGTAIDGKGINIGEVYTGTLNTDLITIGNQDNPSFRWDKSGISAYKLGQDGIYDLKTYVRYDQYGLYGIDKDKIDVPTFKAESLAEVKEKASFAVTWDGFFIKNTYPGGGRVSLSSDNDFQIITKPNGITEQEKIKIGALEWGKDGSGNSITSPDTPGATLQPTLYGIRIKNNTGNTVMKTGDDGNLEITGTIYAEAGEIGGMVVNDNWLRMNYIVLEPGVGIYSTYPNVKGESSVSAYPFWISDTDGSAIFNNVTVRGSIKTSVFEYEEIQAVGGAFLFRPSSAIRSVERDGSDLIFTVEKPKIFREGSWIKISNYSSANGEEVSPDQLNGYGLTYVYPIPLGGINGRQVKLTGAAAIIDSHVTTIDDLSGGSLIDMGNLSGTQNYGIGINSSDGFINLPPRAISLFESVIHPSSDPKVSYLYRGILGTLPDERTSNLDVNGNVYYNMRGTQGIYTDNMYIGDSNQYIAFYKDRNTNEKHLRIKAADMIFDVDDEGNETTWNEYISSQTPIRVVITSNKGEMFLQHDIAAELTCTVYKGNEDITGQVIEFTWSKKNSDGTIDTTWRRLGARNKINITNEDVESKAIFECAVVIDERIPITPPPEIDVPDEYVMMLVKK